MSNLVSANSADKRSPSYDVTSCDSAWMFSLKALLFPVTAVSCLFLCLLLWRQPLTGGYFLAAVIGFVGVGELLDVSKLEQFRPRTATLRAFPHIAIRWSAVCLCVAVILNLSRVPIQFTAPPLLLWAFSTPIVMWVVQFFVWRVLLVIGTKHMQPRTAVIVGVNEQAKLLDQMLADKPLLRIRVLGFFSESHRLPSVDQDWLPDDRSLGTIESLQSYMHRQAVQIVYITLPMARSPEMEKLLDELRDSVASVYFVPDVFALSLLQARIDVVHGIPLISVCDSPFYGLRTMVKRLSDLALAGLILICILPLLAAVALGVKLSSPGPIIFKQKRYGLDGREITVYKFRSMTVTEDGRGSYTQVTRHDSRVTKFGAFIRRTSLDELPQFLNVLSGTMSVVGPRPHAIAVNEHYRTLIPSYMIRHKVKPGITGWAQVNGYRGGDDLPTMVKRIELDLQYLSNWSLWLDAKIVLRTVLVVFKDCHAY